MRYRISPASAADYPIFARLFPELGVPEATPSEDRFAQVIVPGAIMLRDANASADVAVGYAWARARGERLHLVHVIVDPAHRRRGVGRALMDAMASRARAEGFVRWMLHVKPENVAARALYERYGLRVVLEGVSMRIAWADVARLALVSDVMAEPLAPTPDADARFEDALALPRGEIGAYRALPGRILFGATTAGAPVGFAAFDPSFPGASPFRVRVPEQARALFEAMRPSVLPGRDHLIVSAEDDPALEAALTAAGARPIMRTLRMEGDVAHGSR